MKKEAVMQEIGNDSMEVALEVLGKSIARWTDKGEQHITAVPGLSLFRRDEPTEPISGMYEPSICLVAQGAKRVLLGDDTYVYDAHHYLITSVHLPTVVQIIDASQEKPYLGLRLKLDQREISQLMADSNLPPPRAQRSSRGMATGEVTVPLLNAFQRLIDLLAEREGHSDPCPGHPAGDHLPSACGRSRCASAPDCVDGEPEPSDSAVNRLVEGQFHTADEYRRPCSAGRHEQFDVPSSLPVDDRFKPVTVPEATALAGSQASDVGRTYGCRDGSISGRL